MDRRWMMSHTRLGTRKPCRIARKPCRIEGPEALERRRVLSAEPSIASGLAMVEWQGHAVEARLDRWVGHLANADLGLPVGSSVLAAPLSASHPGWQASALGGGYFSLVAPAATKDEVLCWAASTPAVVGIEPDLAFQATAVPNDPSFASQWALRNTGQNGGVVGADIRATQAWDVTTGSRSVVVGIVDSGIDVTHPDLAANIWTNPGEIPGNGIDDDHNGYVDDVHGWNFVDNTNVVDDGFGHGTHVAGIVGAVGNNGVGVAGVAWQVSLMALKFEDSRGIGSTSSLLAALNYATMMRRDFGINIVATNNSWQTIAGYSQVMQQAIQAEGDAGIVFVAAAGNNGTDCDATPSYPGSYHLPNMITVAAMDGGNSLAGLSNYGATSVDLGAPGIMIQSTFPGAAYGLLSGTSMAAPQVTGVVALLAAAKPGITVAEARSAILGSTAPVAALAGKTVTGGRLDARAALDALNLPPQNPPAPAPPPVLSPPAAPRVALLHDTGSSDTDGITNDGRLSISGVEALDHLEYSANLGRTWALAFTARQGVNTVMVRQADPAGLRSQSTSLVFTLDTIAPLPARASLAHDTGARANDRITRDGTLQIAAEPGARIEYSVDHRQTWADSFTAVEGWNAVWVRQTDVAGNVSRPTATALAFTLISTGPQIVAVSTPATRVYRTGGLLDVVVTFARPVTVFLPNGGRPTIDITIGSRTVRAVYVAGSGGTHLRFRYRVTADDATPPDSGILLDGTIQIPAGSLIRDLAGNDAILAFGRPDTSGVRVNPVA